MGRRRKPGTPGRTTIPSDVVSAVTERLHAEFVKHGFDEDYDLFIVAQQSYLYIEVARHPLGCGADCKPASPPSPSSRTPLGRLRQVEGGEWEHQPYRWADEDWDEKEVDQGTPEELLTGAMLQRVGR